MSKSRLLKPTILSLSFLSILSGAAVSPALGRIQQAFPEASELTVQMILTLTPLFIIPFSLLTGRLSLKINKRHILFAGLTIYLLAGVGGGLMNSMPMILVMRALLGIGTGLISALSLSLIADFYHGNERSTTMGQSSAIATLGGIVLTLLSGWLALLSWRFAFGAYLVSLIVLIMVYFYLPEPPTSNQQKSSQPAKLPVGVYGMGFLTILLMIVFYLIPTQIALFLQETNIGDAGQSGISIATMNLAAFIVGLAFGSIRKHLKSLTTILSLLSLGGGLIALNFVQTFPAVLVSLFIAGLGIGTIMPTIFLTTANLVPDELNGPALSITNSSLYLGQFLSPLFFSLIGTLFNMHTIRLNFFSGGLLTLLAALLFIVWLLTQKNLKAA
ncbi:MAG: MFS transporter [Anaerolineaceae bacterium]|jgi:MFS family permease|nr:MFS transporter [Anaerolineaceae bacterium]